MQYEIKRSNWGLDIEIFDHNDKSVLKAYYKSKNWHSSYRYLISEINGEQFEITTPINFWKTKRLIKINNEPVGEVFYKNMMTSPYRGFLLNGNEYLFKHYYNLLKFNCRLFNHKNEILISTRTKTKLFKPDLYFDTDTDILKEDVPHILLITYHLFRQVYNHY